MAPFFCFITGSPPRRARAPPAGPSAGSDTGCPVSVPRHRHPKGAGAPRVPEQALRRSLRGKGPAVQHLELGGTGKRLGQIVGYHDDRPARSMQALQQLQQFQLVADVQVGARLIQQGWCGRPGPPPWPDTPSAARRPKARPASGPKTPRSLCARRPAPPAPCPAR